MDCKRVFSKWRMVCLLCSLLSMIQFWGQPVSETPRTIKGVTLYRDAKDPQLHYFLPSALQLTREENGRPAFQFLNLRYTGTRCRNEEGEQRFTSLLQFDVSMRPIDKDTLSYITSLLKNRRGKVTLRPMPLRYIEARVILTTDGKEQYLGGPAPLEAPEKGGLSTSKSFWTQRSFGTHLNSHDAQILLSQLEEERLSLSFSYSYYADLYTEELSLNTNNSEIREILEGKEEDNLQTRLVYNNTFALDLDVERWPDLVKKIDLNEQYPPSYAAFVVTCYDFRDNLRPDLYMKTVEIETESIGGPIISFKTRFTKKHKELTRKRVRFSYAVRMDTPIRYLISEVLTDGNRITGEWQPLEHCSETLDITSAHSEQPTELRSVEIEIDPLIRELEGNVQLRLLYPFLGKETQQELLFSPRDESSLKSLLLNVDRMSEMQFKSSYLIDNEEVIIDSLQTLKDDYLYLKLDGISVTEH